MSSPKLNNQGYPVPPVKGASAGPAKNSRSPRALREHNSDPYHFEQSVSIEMDEPSRKDPVNASAWKHQGERYSPMHGA